MVILLLIFRNSSSKYKVILDVDLFNAPPRVGISFQKFIGFEVGRKVFEKVLLLTHRDLRCIKANKC